MKRQVEWQVRVAIAILLLPRRKKISDQIKEIVKIITRESIKG